MSFTRRSISVSDGTSRLRDARLLIGCLALAACAPPADGPPEEPPAGVPPEDSVAEPAAEALQAGPVLVGEGGISTAAPEFAAAVAEDGETIYFNRASADRSKLELFVAQRTGDTWDASLVSFASQFWDLDPFLTEDGSRLFVSSNRPIGGGSGAGDFNLWTVEKAGDSWGEPVALGPPVNTEATEIYSTLTSDGVLYFSSNRSGEDLMYRASPIEGGYGEPEVVAVGGVPIAGGNPCIAPDESFLIFSAERDDSYGSSDLYITHRRDGEWSAAENLGEPVNSAFADFAPAIDPAGRTLYFTSERPGIVPAGGVSGRPPGDIYRIELSAIPSVE